MFWRFLKYAIHSTILELFSTTNASCRSANIFELTRTPEGFVSLTFLSKLVELSVRFEQIFIMILMKYVFQTFVYAASRN